MTPYTLIAVPEETVWVMMGLPSLRWERFNVVEEKNVGLLIHAGLLHHRPEVFGLGESPGQLVVFPLEQHDDLIGPGRARE